MKSRTKGTWAAIGAVLLLTVALVFSHREALLLDAGRFMAPQANHIEGVVDVVILEGTEFIDRGMVSKGVELLRSGKARRMAIVLHRIAPNDRPFGLNEDYPSSVRRELGNLGLQHASFTVIVTPVGDPITLTAARGALEVLPRDGVKSAILVSPGFHMRRSLLVYQHLAAPLNIRIYPVACFDEYQLNEWWREENGLRDFVEELQKLMFYLVRGYIPLKLSY
jgi:hypothetical protein